MISICWRTHVEFLFNPFALGVRLEEGSVIFQMFLYEYFLTIYYLISVRFNVFFPKSILIIILYNSCVYAELKGTKSGKESAISSCRLTTFDRSGQKKTFFYLKHNSYSKNVLIYILLLV